MNQLIMGKLPSKRSENEGWEGSASEMSRTLIRFAEGIAVMYVDFDGEVICAAGVV